MACSIATHRRSAIPGSHPPRSSRRSRARCEAIARAVGDRCGLNILDLGCGTGLSGQSLRSRARRLTGIDLSRAMIDRARTRRVYDELGVAEITAFLDAPDGERYDLIAACDA